MKFLCDVHISYRLAKHIQNAGHTAIHVNTILDKWLTKDNDIAAYADTNDLIIISKDADFRDAHFINKSPRKLIKVNLGNISNDELILLFDQLLQRLKNLDTTSPFIIELDRDNINYISI